MFLNMGSPTTETDLPLFDNWEEQTEIELTLLMIVGICIPAMLFVKPIILSLTGGHKKHDVKEEKKDDNFKSVDHEEGSA